MNITVCHLCGRVYKNRPTLCDCKSNAFLKDYENATEKDLQYMRYSIIGMLLQMLQ